MLSAQAELTRLATVELNITEFNLLVGRIHKGPDQEHNVGLALDDLVDKVLERLVLEVVNDA